VLVADADQLPLFEDQKVHGSQVRIIKAGDGLSEALDIKPAAMHIGQVTDYVIRTVVRQVNHKENKSGALHRVHTVEVVAITEVDHTVADEIIRESAEALEKARAERAGQQSMLDEQAAEAKEAGD
jgi:hypothetical protein